MRSEAYDARFPAERRAHGAMSTTDGRRLVSEPTEARGGPGNFLTDDELARKYRQLAEPVAGAERTARIEGAIDRLLDDPAAGADELMDGVLTPP